MDIIVKTEDAEKRKTLISQMKLILQRDFRRTSVGQYVERAIYDDILLSRWLEAHHNSPILASLMLCETFYWRKENHVDSILGENYISLFHATFPIYFGSHDNFGRPVIFVPLRKWRIEEIPKLARTGDFKRFVISIFEEIMRDIEQRRRNETRRVVKESLCKFSVIINMHGVSGHAFLNFEVVQNIFLFTKILETHYPRTLLKCIFVNCGNLGLCKTILRFLMRPSLWTPRQTPSCLQLYKVHSNWKDVLRSIIPSEELLMELGGWKKTVEYEMDAHSVGESQHSQSFNLLNDHDFLRKP